MRTFKLFLWIVVAGMLFSCVDDLRPVPGAAQLSISLATPSEYTTRSVSVERGKTAWVEGDVVHIGITFTGTDEKEISKSHITATYVTDSWVYEPAVIVYPEGAVLAFANAWYIEGNMGGCCADGFLNLTPGEQGVSDVLYSMAVTTPEENRLAFDGWVHPVSRLRVQAVSGFSVRVKGGSVANRIDLYGKDTSLFFYPTDVSAIAGESGSAFFYGKWRQWEALSIYVDTISRDTALYSNVMKDNSIPGNSYVVEVLPAEEMIGGKAYTLIYTAAGLKAFADKVNFPGENDSYPNIGSCAKLMADIDLTDVCATEAGWVRIGPSAHRYAGTFLGNDKKISGLSMNRPDVVFQGLFGEITGSSTIRDLTLVSPKIVCKDRSAPLVCRSSGKIINCHVTAHPDSVIISGIGSETVAGLVYWNLGKIISCSSSGTIKTKGDLSGGLVGYMSLDTSLIIASYADVTVVGKGMVGGLVGRIGKGKVIGSYATGSAIGGLLGDMEYSARAEYCVTTQNTIGPRLLGTLVEVHCDKKLSEIYDVFRLWEEVNKYWEEVPGSAPRQIKQP